MHRPKLEDRFGSVRFRVEYSEKREILLVTIIDAWDLPPMDGDGKADPYLEISLRPGPIKPYTTSIKSNCLNPTFNETAELKLKPGEIEGWFGLRSPYISIAHLSSFAFQAKT